MKRSTGLVLFLLLATLALAQPKIDYRKKGAPIPPFGIEQLNGRILTNAILTAGKPVIVVIFSPECDHCARALDTLKGMSAALKNTQVVLLTEAMHKPQLRDFLATHGFDKEPMFRNVGIEKSNLIFHIYTYGLLPQFNIYNAQHQLVKSFTGNFPMDSLKMYLR